MTVYILCLYFCHIGLNDLWMFLCWGAVAVMTLILEPSSPTLSWFERSDLTLGQESCFWRPLSVSPAVICQPAGRRRPRGLTRAAHVSSVTQASALQPIFNTAAVCLCLGRLPGEHFADNLGDPQRGGREWDHNHGERDPQLLLHGVGQLGGPVQEAERAARVGPPQHGQEHARKEKPSAEAILTAQNQNPRPHRCEHHRQMVTDNIPLQLLPLQRNLLALLCQLMHWCFLNHCLSLSFLTSLCEEHKKEKTFFFLSQRADSESVHSHKELSTELVFYKDFDEL